MEGGRDMVVGPIGVQALLPGCRIPERSCRCLFRMALVMGRGLSHCVWKPGGALRAITHFTGRMIAEIILKVGIFFCFLMCDGKKPHSC